MVIRNWIGTLGWTVLSTGLVQLVVPAQVAMVPRCR
jgi:hypothetical protein